MDGLEFPWLAALPAGVAYFVLGGVWFSQPMFGRLWDRAQGFQRTPEWRYSPAYFVAPLVGSFVVVAALGVLASWVEATSLRDAIALGAAVGGVAAAVSAINAIVPRFPQPVVFGLLTGGYHLTASTLAAVLLVSLS